MKMVRTLLAVSAAATATLLCTTPASAAGPVTVAADVNGKPVARSDDRNPVPVRRGETRLTVRVTNRGGSVAEVAAVRFEGRVLGLTFFASEASLPMTVAPGRTESRQVSLDTTYAQHQAVGLIPGSVSVLDAGRHQLAGQRLIMDVRGSLRSLYGTFGILVAVLTAASFGATVVALARHRLSDNRLTRGVRFLVPGVGGGLVMAFTLSVFRVSSPDTGRCLPMAGVCALALFLVGYLSPSPGHDGPAPVEEPMDTLAAVA